MSDDDETTTPGTSPSDATARVSLDADGDGATEDRADAGPEAALARESEPEVGADDERMRALLKRAVGPSTALASTENPDFLRGVQRKIRERSRGKFYADGWSTSQSRVSYALVAAIMLVVVVLAWLALGPVGLAR